MNIPDYEKIILVFELAFELLFLVEVNQGSFNGKLFKKLLNQCS
jgi:hypothetical protein